jgi:hypothetical protein
MSEMTIARGLTRIKTIHKQLIDIAQKISEYGAWNNQKKIPTIADTKKDIKINHAEAEAEVKSLYQQFHDLSNYGVKVKLAIEKANHETNIEIAGKTFTLAEALLYRRLIAPHVNNLINSYNAAVSRAESDVTRYNKPIVDNANYDESKKRELQADILYLVPNEETKKLGTFNGEFLTELDGRLNEVNAVTTITVPD